MAKPAAPARVLVVEDDVAIAELVAAALGREGFETCLAGDAVAAAAMAKTFHPDLAILDVRLGPGADGLAVARQLRRSSDLPVVFLTEASSVEDRLAGFETGADDYIAKPFELAELLARVRALLRRSGRLTSAVWAVGALSIDEGGRRVFLDGELLDLTRIEFDLLLALARQPGRVATKTQLLANVWGFDGYDPNLVEVHISSVRRKLGGGAGLVQTVRGVGYVLRP